MKLSRRFTKERTSGGISSPPAADPRHDGRSLTTLSGQLHRPTRLWVSFTSVLRLLEYRAPIRAARYDCLAIF
jgi:hypothetical protein